MGPSLFPPPWLAGPAAGADFFFRALATTTNPAKLAQITSYKLTGKRLGSTVELFVSTLVNTGILYRFISCAPAPAMHACVCISHNVCMRENDKLYPAAAVHAAQPRGSLGSPTNGPPLAPGAGPPGLPVRSVVTCNRRPVCAQRIKQRKRYAR